MMACYAYGRVSTDRQENGRDGQMHRLAEAAEREGITFTESYIDEDVSGSVPFNQRPNGKVLWDRLVPGDTVYITKVDRAFRSMSDAAFTLEKWKALGIKVRIIDLGVDLNTPAGEMFFHLLAAFATFERQTISSRTREAIAYRTRQRGIHKNARPLGWQLVRRPDGDIDLAEWPYERKVADAAAKLRDEGMGWKRVVMRLWDMKLRKPKSETNYDSRDLRKLVAARAAGYPKTRQGSWQVSARVEKQPSC
jgi:DNA invertase Pin-like site-specific DNA recombinase